ncbi:hypothetical protein C9975_04775 [Thalassospira xiamenensis]|nr:hypothetical protein C9975_04775 [Thalassospira xiamenensis]
MTIVFKEYLMNTEAIKNTLSENKLTILAISTLVVALFSIATAQAGAGGTQFTAIWTEISGWVDGTPGKIIALLAFSAAMFNVMRQNFVMAVAAFLGCMLMANAVDIINGFMTAGLPVLG